MVAIECFSGTAQITEIFRGKGVQCLSLDRFQLRKGNKIDLLIDFLDFDYRSYSWDHFDFLFFAVPCTAFSKASGGKHFSKSFVPVTSRSEESIMIINRVIEIIKYFSKAVFYIENPAGGLYRYLVHIGFLPCNKVFVYRVDLLVFGFPTKKQTDVITNSTTPIMVSPIHRVNGKYQAKKFSNMTVTQRQTYPHSFVAMIVDNAISNHC